MNHEITIQMIIARILQNIGSKGCLDKAGMLEGIEKNSSSLNLRSLDLQPYDVIKIADGLKNGHPGNGDGTRSITFSYNRSLGDTGAIALAKSLPLSIREIGLVGCGIGDVGGNELNIG